MDGNLFELAEKYIFFNFTKTDKGTIKKFNIRYTKYLQILKDLGFARYRESGQDFLLNVKENIAEMANENDVADAFEDFIEEIPAKLYSIWEIQPEILKDKFYSGLAAYLKPTLLMRLRPEQPIVFNKHTQKAAYFYYRNGFVEVTKEGYELKPYSELKTVVYASQILNRDFVKVEDIGDTMNNSMWGKFLANIAGNQQRYESLQTIIGYNIHSYFEGKLKATILTDSRMSLDMEADGRSGKGLLCRGISHMLNRDVRNDKTYIEVSGKDFQTANRFKYQDCSLETKLIHIDDALRGLDIEGFFVDIASGIKVEKKGQDSFNIQSKIIFSTNRTIKTPSGSAVDRVIEYELADHYSTEFSPQQEFDCWFFRDWTKEQWNDFDNAMIGFVMYYLNVGLKKPENINLEQRKLYEQTAPEFVTYINELLEKEIDFVKIHKQKSFEDFKTAYPDFEAKKWFLQRQFTSWLRIYSKFSSKVIEKECRETRSNSNDYFIFKLNHNETTK